MEVICQECNTKLNIPDQKIPKGQVVKVTCPKCKHKVTIDTREREPHGAPPDAEGSAKPAAEAPPQPPPAPKAPSRYDDEAEELGFIEEGVKLALVLESDPDAAEKIKDAVEELGYRYVTSENTRKAVSKMRLHHFDMVVISDQFDGIEVSQSPVLQYLNHLSMSVRRRIFLALIGDGFKTMDNMMAFVMSANLVINREDMDRLPLILKQGIAENERFYKVFMDTLTDTGKA